MSLPDPLVTHVTDANDNVYTVTTPWHPPLTNQGWIDEHCRKVFDLIETLETNPAWKLMTPDDLVKTLREVDEGNVSFSVRHHDEIKEAYT